MKKYLTKLWLLLPLMALLLLTNCQDDLYDLKQEDVQFSNQSKFVILIGQKAKDRKEKTIASLKKNGGKAMARLKNKLNPGADTNPLLRTVSDIEPYIDGSQVANVTTYTGLNNYTLRVNLPDAADDKFYNLVVSENEGHEKITLITYNLEKEFSEVYKLDGDFSKFTGTMEFEILDEEEDYPCFGGGFPITVPINSGGGGGAGPGGGSGGPGSGGVPSSPMPPPRFIDVPDAPREQVVAIQYNSIDITPIIVPITATTLPFYPPATGGGGTVTFPPMMVYGIDIPGITGNNPCNFANLIGILLPYNPSIEHDKNCAELAKMGQNTAILNSYNSLRSSTQMSGYNGKFREYGYLFTDSQDPSPLQLAPGSIESLTVPTGGNIYGASHSHPDPSNEIQLNAPMFSLSDIFKLTEIAKKYTPENGILNKEKCVFTLTVLQGSEPIETYALKVENWAQLSQFYYQYLGSTSEDKRKKGQLLQKKYTIARDKNSAGIITLNYLQELFKFLAEQNIKGLSIYKAKNNNLTEWERMDYDPDTKTITPKPCK